MKKLPDRRKIDEKIAGWSLPGFTDGGPIARCDNFYQSNLLLMLYIHG